LFPVTISGSYVSRTKENRLFCSGKCLFSPGTQLLTLLPEKVQKGRLEDGTQNKVHTFPGTNPPAGA
jgi:hypothetical protein